MKNEKNEIPGLGKPKRTNKKHAKNQSKYRKRSRGWDGEKALKAAQRKIKIYFSKKAFTNERRPTWRGERCVNHPTAQGAMCA